jgi:hypothetical protein
MNKELGRKWMEVVVAYLRYYLRISLEGLRKTIKDLSQDSWSLR